MLHGILGCCLSCAHKYWLSASHGIPALNDDEIELRIKRDLPVSRSLMVILWSHHEV